MSNEAEVTAPVSPLLDSREVASYLKVSGSTLSRWRSAETGLPFIKLAGIARYRLEAISTDMERRSYGIRARARWTDPLTKQRVIRTEIVKDEATARAFFETLRNSSVKGMDISMKGTRGDHRKPSVEPTPDQTCV